MIEDEEGKRRFYEGVQHVPDHLLLDWTARIQSGEKGNEIHGFAVAIIHDFSLRLTLGHEQSPVTMRWLADVLEDVAEYRDPKRVLELLGLMPRPKKRPADPHRAVDVALWLRSAQQRGYSASEAVHLAADCFCKDVKTIERYRKAAGDWAEGMNPEASWERYFMGAKPPRPLPPPRDKK